MTAIDWIELILFTLVGLWLFGILIALLGILWEKISWWRTVGGAWYLGRGRWLCAIAFFVIIAAPLAAAGEIDLSARVLDNPTLEMQAHAPHKPGLAECHPYPEVVIELMLDFGEVSQGRDLVDNSGTAVEVFIGGRGSITIVEVYPNDLACYRAFQDFPGSWNAPPIGSDGELIPMAPPRPA